MQVPTNPIIEISPPFSPRPPSSHISASAARIADLCEVLKQKTQSKCCLGFLDSQDNQPWQDHIYSVNPPSLHKDATQPATLAEIVHERKNDILGTRQKYHSNRISIAVSTDFFRCALALTLASAVLQLHDTPWLSKSWNMKDILFINHNTKATSPLGQPYVSKVFTPTRCSQDSTISRSRCFTKNEIVFALGIALLELSHGKPISSFTTADDLDQGNETIYTEYSIANRLTKTIDQREFINYAQATLRCVTCNFGTFTNDLNNDDFRERFYQGVILPLQQDYEYATSVSAQLQSFS